MTPAKRTAVRQLVGTGIGGLLPICYVAVTDHTPTWVRIWFVAWIAIWVFAALLTGLLIALTD